MRIIKIQSEENGAHQYQTISVKIPLPDGYALVPDDMVLENCPFGELTAEEVKGVKTVTKWVAGTIPESEEPAETAPTEIEQLRADVDYIAIMTGVDL